jgi:hypothetical protein
MLLLDGVPLTLASKRLGHAKVSMTLGIYSHILPGISISRWKASGRRCLGNIQMSAQRGRRVSNGSAPN